MTENNNAENEKAVKILIFLVKKHNKNLIIH